MSLLLPPAPARRLACPAASVDAVARVDGGQRGQRGVGCCAASGGGIGGRACGARLRDAFPNGGPVVHRGARSESKNGAWMRAATILPIGDRARVGPAVYVPPTVTTESGEKRSTRSIQVRARGPAQASPLSDASAAPYVVQNGDTLTSIAKKSKTSVRILANANGIANVDLLLAGQLLLIPAESDLLERPASQAVEDDEFPISRGVNWHDQVSAGALSSGESSQQVDRHLAASFHRAPGLKFAILAVAILLLAPLLGFCVRCMVDTVYMEGPEMKRQQETEESEVLRRPKSQRWQKILEEDRDGREFSPSSAGEPTAARLWGGDDVWSQDSNVRMANPENSQIETDEEVRLRHKRDYEEIRNSYAELESSYVKFLADSGMSKSGYWRGSGVPTPASLDDTEPR